MTHNALLVFHCLAFPMWAAATAGALPLLRAVLGAVFQGDTVHSANAEWQGPIYTQLKREIWR